MDELLLAPEPNCHYTCVFRRIYMDSSKAGHMLTSGLIEPYIHLTALHCSARPMHHWIDRSTAPPTYIHVRIDGYGRKIGTPTTLQHTAIKLSRRHKRDTKCPNQAIAPLIYIKLPNHGASINSEGRSERLGYKNRTARTNARSQANRSEYLVDKCAETSGRPSQHRWKGTMVRRQ